MLRIEITVNGQTYPCYQTGAAMLPFKDLTGKEVTEIPMTEEERAAIFEKQKRRLARALIS